VNLKQAIEKLRADEQREKEIFVDGWEAGDLTYESTTMKLSVPKDGWATFKPEWAPMMLAMYERKLATLKMRGLYDGPTELRRVT
jgi:hypothetical protein